MQHELNKRNTFSSCDLVSFTVTLTYELYQDNVRVNHQVSQMTFRSTISTSTRIQQTDCTTWTTKRLANIENRISFKKEIVKDKTVVFFRAQNIKYSAEAVKINGCRRSCPTWPITLINGTLLFRRERSWQSAVADTNGPESLRSDTAPRVSPFRGCYDSLVLSADTWSITTWCLTADGAKLASRLRQTGNRACVWQYIVWQWRNFCFISMTAVLPPSCW